MMKKTEGGAHEAGPGERPSPRHALVRKCRYVGPNGRAFDSIPFGERIAFHSGQTYEVSEAFAYLWSDPHFAPLFEWEGEPYYVDVDADKNK